jgi:hypothetical protein
VAVIVLALIFQGENLTKKGSLVFPGVRNYPILFANTA